MSFQLNYSDQAKKDLQLHKKTGNNAVLIKIFALLDEIKEHPLTGTGRPEQLKHNLSGYWSRRINKEHRLVYKIQDDIVNIISVYGHYK